MFSIWFKFQIDMIFDFEVKVNLVYKGFSPNFTSDAKRFEQLINFYSPMKSKNLWFFQGRNRS